MTGVQMHKNIFLDPEIIQKQCRICLETEAETDKPIIHPCRCKGSQGEVHESCLKTWIVSQNKQLFTQCEICKFDYQIMINSKKVCIPRKLCKRNTESICGLCCLINVVSGFVILQIYIILQIETLYNGNNTSSSEILSNPITMIGFCVVVFLCLIPLTCCLVMVVVKMLFITKIKEWSIQNRPQTPIQSEENMHMNQSIYSRQSLQSRNSRAQSILQQVPRIVQHTQVLIQARLVEHESQLLL